MFMSHLDNEVFSRHAKHYYYYYHSYHCLKNSLILGDKSPFQRKGLKTLQLSPTLQNFPPGVEVDVPAPYQERVKSPRKPKLPVTGSIN